MKLHGDKVLFADVIARAAAHPSQGGLGIPPQFIEKDYWITNALKHLSESRYKDNAVFKGGTSLSKAYHIGTRFSEDIDIAIIKTDGMTDAQLKTTIRSTEKVMSADLIEIAHPQSSKGSRYRKTFYSYPLLSSSQNLAIVIPGQLLFEINSFGNPFPYQNIEISCFAYHYLATHMANDIIKEFELEPFRINVLDKRTTMTEKIVSLVRFSLAKYPIPELEAKIRHFYDLHYLLQDPDSRAYLHSTEFAKNFISLITHDKELFDNPEGWRKKLIENSPLILDFSVLWEVLKKRYSEELRQLSYSLTIPSVDAIETSMKEILDELKNL